MRETGLPVRVPESQDNLTKFVAKDIVELEYWQTLWVARQWAAFDVQSRQNYIATLLHLIAEWGKELMPHEGR